MEVLFLAERRGRPDGVEELFEDQVQPLDFRAGGGEVFLQRPALAGRQFAQFAAEKLEVDIERVERVADFMGDTGGEQGERVESLGFEIFLRLRAGAGEIADEHHVAERLVVVLRAIDRREVEIQVAVLRIENLQVAADRAARFAQDRPVEPADLGGNELAGRLLRIESEELARRVIEETDHAFRIQNDHALMQRLEDFFQESFLADQAGDDLLDVAGNHAIQPGDQLFQKAGFHLVVACFGFPVFRNSHERRFIGPLHLPGFRTGATDWHGPS